MTQSLEGSLSRAGSLPLVGGMLALDLCNTSSGRESEAPVENLKTARDVLAWMQHAAVLGAEDVATAGRRTEADPVLGSELRRRVLQLRDTVYELGKAIADREPIPRGRVDELAQMHGQCAARAKLSEQSDGRFIWIWDRADDLVDSAVGPVVLSALRLLKETEQRRVKRCHGDRCGWLFLDTTKNNSRRWCEMEVCGNRAKQKRHQHRLLDRSKSADGS